MLLRNTLLLLFWLSAAAARAVTLLSIDFQGSQYLQTPSSTTQSAGVRQAHALAVRGTEVYAASGRSIYRTSGQGGAALVKTVVLPVGSGIRGLAVHPVTGDFYLSVDTGSVLASDILYRYRPSDDTMSLLGAVGFGGVQGIEFSVTGTLYGWDTPTFGITGAGWLEINIDTGMGTDLHPGTWLPALVPGQSNPQVYQSLAPVEGGAYVASQNRLYFADLDDDALTLVASMPSNDIRGLVVLIPEPAGGLLLCAVAAGMAVRRRRRCER